MAISLEVCIDSALAFQAAKAAFAGGADRIELCSQMNLDGLTPSGEAIKQARQAFHKPGLMVMIRPRDSFVFTPQEQEQMLQSIQNAKNAGADGVVFGALKEQQLDIEVTRALTQQAQALGLSTTFHRAFDAVNNQPEALESLIRLGVNRVLTSGTAWDSKQDAIAGLNVIASLLKQAEERIEIIVGGGVNYLNLPKILQALESFQSFSLHTFSGAQEHGVTTAKAVRRLKDTHLK